MESFVARLLSLKDALPAPRRQIFDLLYQQGQSREACAERLGLSPQEFDSEHRAMLRALRLGAASA